MIDDEMPVDEDELAVEEEFRNKPPVREPGRVNPPAPPKPVTESVPPVPPPPQNRPAPTPTPAPQPPKQARPQTPTPSSVPPSSNTDRLRFLAMASGLSTSMDNIENNNTMLFDIEVMETGDDGRPLVHVERGVSASSEAELRGLYAMSDQRIKILRTYGNNPPAPPSASPTPAPVQAPVVQPPTIVENRKPPKFFNISGVECKLENGRVYQRQWVRLAGADAESFRLVNDVNNKIVPIDGKHIEQKKWVLIQENPDEGE